MPRRIHRSFARVVALAGGGAIALVTLGCSGGQERPKVVSTFFGNGTKVVMTTSSDADETYTPQQLRSLIDWVQKNPEVRLAQLSPRQRASIIAVIQDREERQRRDED